MESASESQTVAPLERDVNDETPFPLPAYQQRWLCQGKVPNNPDRKPIIGASSDLHHVKAARNTHNIHYKVVYVGAMDDRVTIQDMKLHLRDIGIKNIVDVLQLLYREGKQSSFCVRVSAMKDEEILYDPHNWPLGVRVKLYQYRPLAAKRQHHSQTDRRTATRHNHHYHHQQQCDYHYPDNCRKDNNSIWPTLSSASGENLHFHQQHHQRTYTWCHNQAHCQQNPGTRFHISSF